jgi:DNA-binding transcriptional regulator YhcF (GntR family)
MSIKTLLIDRKSKNSPSSQIDMFFRARIKNKKYLPGDQLPTTNEIIEGVNVSPQTIRQAFNRLKEDGLVESIPGRGTFVRDKNSPQLKSKEGSSVRLKRVAVAGAFDPKVRGGWYRRLAVGGVTWQCNQSGAAFCVLPNDLLSCNADKIAKYLYDMKIDGLVWIIPDQESWPKIEELIKKNFPLVVIRLAHGNDSICSVEVDHQAVGFDSVKHFIDRGCSNVSFLSYDRADVDPDIVLRYGSYPSDLLFGLSRALTHYKGTFKGVINEYALGSYKESPKDVDTLLRKTGPETGLFFVDGMQLINYLNAFGQEAIDLLSDRQVIVITNRDNYNMFMPYVKNIQMYTHMEESEKLGVLAVQKLAGQINGDLLNTCTQLKLEVTLEEFSPTKLAIEALDGIDFHMSLGT